MAPHLLRCQGLEVAYYDFALGRLEATAPSTFAQSGLYQKIPLNYATYFKCMLFPMDGEMRSIAFLSDLHTNQ